MKFLLITVLFLLCLDSRRSAACDVSGNPCLVLLYDYNERAEVNMRVGLFPDMEQDSILIDTCLSPHPFTLTELYFRGSQFTEHDHMVSFETYPFTKKPLAVYDTARAEDLTEEYSPLKEALQSLCGECCGLRFLRVEFYTDDELLENPIFILEFDGYFRLGDLAGMKDLPGITSINMMGPYDATAGVNIADKPLVVNTAESFTIDLQKNTRPVDIRLIDQMGREVAQAGILYKEGSEIRIDKQAAPQGVYFLLAGGRPFKFEVVK